MNNFPMQQMQQPMGFGMQPMQMQGTMWMQPQQAIPGCPAGLEYLLMLDQVLIKQEKALLEIFTPFEVANKYRIFNNLGQQCYYAFEESSCLCKQCCGNRRSFKMHVSDNTGADMMVINRPFKCCSQESYLACCSICQEEVEVTQRDGTILGTIRQSCSCCKPGFTVMDDRGNQQYEIWGPCCDFTCPCCRKSVDYNVYRFGGNEVIAKISKQWSGLITEMFTDADNFGVSFPMDMDVKMKATLLGAVFLIDFMFYENEQSGNRGE